MSVKLNELMKTVATPELSEDQQKQLASDVADLTDLENLAIESAREGLSGLMVRHFKAAGIQGLLPVETFHALQDSCYRITQLNLQLIEALRELLEVLAGESLKVVLLQGMPLQHYLYGDPSLRPMSDVDMWVRPGDFSRLSELLKAYGYRQDRLYPETFTRNRIKIDIHTHLFWADRIRSRKWLIRCRQDHIFHDTIRVDVDGAAAYRLSPSDEVLYLCTHLMKHHAERMIWLLDLYLLTVDWSPQRWDQLFARGGELGLEKQLVYGFTLVRDVLGRPLSEPMHRFLSRQPLNPLENWLLKQRRQKGSLPSWGPLVWFTVGKSLPRKILMAWETLFPSVMVLRQVFPNHSRREAMPLYLLRIGQLLRMTK